MKIIAHRGNTKGPNPKFENNPNYLQESLDTGYDVEVDLRVENNELKLGHDFGQYIIDLNWLMKRQKNLWIHCKNVPALELMTTTQFNYFWHDTDDYTLTSHGYVWAYPGKINVGEKCVLVMPENVWSVKDTQAKYGICTDYCDKYKKT